jgi:hypothetical protein
MGSSKSEKHSKYISAALGIPAIITGLFTWYGALLDLNSIAYGGNSVFLATFGLWWTLAMLVSSALAMVIGAYLLFPEGD